LGIDFEVLGEFQPLGGRSRAQHEREKESRKAAADGSGKLFGLGEVGSWNERRVRISGCGRVSGRSES